MGLLLPAAVNTAFVTTIPLFVIEALFTITVMMLGMSLFTLGITASVLLDTKATHTSPMAATVM
jgi:hypothetical protein